MIKREFLDGRIVLYNGDCKEVMAELDRDLVDSIVSDPPYGLSFMGKKWDYDVPSQEIWENALKVLKHGGHLLAFAGTRTQHRMAVRIEDAGFEIREMVAWVYGSGFPKSLNIGKAVDKLQGNEREFIGEKVRGDVQKAKETGSTFAVADANKNNEKIFGYGVETLTKGTSEWEGWGTALKPAIEPITMARKPLEKGLNIAQNCLKHGVGGINIDESRVGTTGARNNGNSQGTVGSNSIGVYGKAIKQDYNMGRFPANLITDGSEEVRECFPETKSGKAGIRTSGGFNDGIYGKGMGIKAGQDNGEFGDSGNASRFFKSIIYQAKASKSERNKGCEGLPLGEPPASARSKPAEGRENALGNPRTNNHPTVKPIALMEYLIKMVTPKGGIVLDPFMGSGSTGVAAVKTGNRFIGIELDEDYFNIACARIEEELRQQNLF